jgi:hypothetical protein
MWNLQQSLSFICYMFNFYDIFQKNVKFSKKWDFGYFWGGSAGNFEPPVKLQYCLFQAFFITNVTRGAYSFNLSNQNPFSEWLLETHFP